MIDLRTAKSIANKFVSEQFLLYSLWPNLKKIFGISFKPRKLLRFQIHLTEHCNLNCKGCSAFCPISKEKYLDLDIYERDLKRLSNLTERKVEFIELIGGEPLLHPNIVDIIIMTGKYFIINGGGGGGKINILTNGLLLIEINDVFWESCCKFKVEITISVYPINLNLTAIMEKAEEYRVKIILRGDTGGIKIWNKLPLDLDGKQCIKDNFIVCHSANNCITLNDGKLATCGWIFNAKRFSQYFNTNFELQSNEGNYIDIFKAKNIKEIFSFLANPIPFCKYCNIKENIYDVKWGISKKEISEWI
jgi:hypothetical protein